MFTTAFHQRTFDARSPNTPKPFEFLFNSRKPRVLDTRVIWRGRNERTAPWARDAGRSFLRVSEIWQFRLIGKTVLLPPGGRPHPRMLAAFNAAEQRNEPGERWAWRPRGDGSTFKLVNEQSPECPSHVSRQNHYFAIASREGAAARPCAVSLTRARILLRGSIKDQWKRF